ncbi:MBL fold metallo-hydrolase [Bosea sp. TND4EK4]|uniref:MBL fold metallo-hydrolase n=1 Tax=Bosea sp. TND4EK4 TaxID=1907408 RepID=UPI0009562ED2|nr:MBL fold metallo-hydrolase [Bosea sp. TND4EK4]SIQ31549.1 L-ascorbate metabolism protein UlaG, beta-lactamase superfamily [Bosea sp. TND4EK4]
MNRRKLLSVLGPAALFASAGTAWAAVSRSRNPYYQGPVSDHFDGLAFSDGRTASKGLLDVLRWQTGKREREAFPVSYPAPPQDKPPASVEGVRIVHLGHASFLYQMAGLNLLVDPVLSERASPFTFIGPRRVNPPGVAFDDLPVIDAVLVTHNHYDHLDIETLARIHRRDRPRMIMPLGNDTIVKARIPDARTEAHDWSDKLALSDALTITLTPTYHWSARGAFDRRMALWCSFILEAGGIKIFHVGDTGFHDGSLYERLGREHGPFNLAVLPIGAYEPRWFMAENHMNPEEAVKVMLALRAEQALGHHWGTFQLTDEGIERPPEALKTALAAAGLAEERFRPMRPGLSWTA